MTAQKPVTLTVSITANDSGHPTEASDVQKALSEIIKQIKAGATGGRLTTDAPHSHMGESCSASYKAIWSMEGLDDD